MHSYPTYIYKRNFLMTSQGTHPLSSTLTLLLLYDPLWLYTVSGTFRHPRHMSFVADLHLTVTRPECVTTPYRTFPLLIVLITFLFLFCLFSHWYTCANFTIILTSLFQLVFLLYRLI